MHLGLFSSYLYIEFHISSQSVNVFGCNCVTDSQSSECPKLIQRMIVYTVGTGFLVITEEIYYMYSPFKVIFSI